MERCTGCWEETVNDLQLLGRVWHQVGFRSTHPHCCSVFPALPELWVAFQPLFLAIARVCTLLLCNTAAQLPEVQLVPDGANRELRGLGHNLEPASVWPLQSDTCFAWLLAFR